MKNILILGIASVTTLLINNNNKSRNKDFINITKEKIEKMNDIEFIEYLNYEINLSWKDVPEFRKTDYRKIGFDEYSWKYPESNEISNKIFDLSWKNLESNEENKTYLETLKSLRYNKNTWDNYTLDEKENKIKKIN